MDRELLPKDSESILKGHWAESHIRETYLPIAEKVVEGYRRVKEICDEKPETTLPRFVWHDHAGEFVEYSQFSDPWRTRHPLRSCYVFDRLEAEPDVELLALGWWERAQIPPSIDDLDQYTKTIVGA
jgi:hypothetical protein